MSTLILHLPAGPAGEYAYALSSDGLRADRHGHAAAGLLPLERFCTAEYG